MFGQLSNVCKLALVLALVFLSGCKEESLYTGLTEQEANEMVALMQRAGIPASKVAGKDSAFAVTTEADQFADAVQLLQANGLPRPSFDSLGKVFQDQGFVTSNVAQRARYIHALSQEISHTISSIDGVILARVHLAVPERDPLSDVKVESSASVFVKHRADVDLSSHVSQIKALVINGLENLPYENVTVALFEAMPQSTFHTLPKLVTPSVPVPDGTINTDIQNIGKRSPDGQGSQTATQTASQLASKMSILPEISPLGLIVAGLALLLFVLSGLLWSIWFRSRERATPFAGKR